MRGAIQIVWQVSVLAQLAVAVRLLYQGLGGFYPALLAASCVLPIRAMLLMASYAPSASHDQMREVTRQLAPVEWIVHAWLVFELFSCWTRSYKGIGRFGKMLLGGLLLLALLLSVAFWPTEWQALVFAHNFRIYYILNRVVWATLAIFVVGMWLFFRNYPVAIAPNVPRHTWVALTYFVVSAASYWLFTLNGLKVVPMINLTLVTVTAGCFFAWAVVLTRAGQAVPQSEPLPIRDRERIERINEELLELMGNFAKRTP